MDGSGCVHAADLKDSFPCNVNYIIGGEHQITRCISEQTSRKQKARKQNKYLVTV